MLDRLKKIIIKESFDPEIIGVFINPYYFPRRNLIRAVRNNQEFMFGKCLDVGCGSKPYENCFANIDEYIGMDIEISGHIHRNESIDVFYNGEKFPFADETLDCVFSTQALEHIFNIDEIISEMYRVLKKDGSCLVIMPFCWNEHEVPFDCARYSSYGVKYLFEKSGFNIEKQEKIGTYMETICALFNAYLDAILPKGKYIGLISRILFCGSINILGIGLSKILPKNDTLYLDNVVVLRK